MKFDKLYDLDRSITLCTYSTHRDSITLDSGLILWDGPGGSKPKLLSRKRF